MNKFTSVKKQLGENALYRFVPFNQYSLQTLLNHKLYFSNPHVQNDPIDSRYVLDLTSFPLTHYKNSFSDERPEVITKRYIRVQIDMRLKEEFGIISLSNKYNNLLLWSHYTMGATGFCLMFDKSKLINSLKGGNKTMEIEKVKYGKTPSIVPTLIENKLHFDHRKIIFFKHKEWSYESEVRILCKLDKTPFNHIIRQYKFDHGSLISIIFGERMSWEERHTIINILRLKEYEHVHLFKKIRDNDNPRSYKYLAQK